MANKKSLTPGEDKTVFGACHYQDATGKMTCDDGVTAEECAALNGVFFPNQQCPESAKAKAKPDRVGTSGQVSLQLRSM
jgi:hypothetical protein